MAHDVIVVGAGPAGSTAAKRCVEQGLSTLLLEKCRLPRDKVCSGMIMGPVAHTLIKEEFGDLPESVLTQPKHLSGYFLHVPGVGGEKVNNFTLLTWRRKLDYWMVQRAQDRGVEVWDGASVVNITPQGEDFSASVRIGDQWQQLTSKFVVGADGGASVVRRRLFPDLKMRYAQIYQEQYRGEINLEKEYCHWFYPPEHSPEFFDLHQKDGLIIVDVGGRIGRMDKRISRTKDFLAKHYQFDPSQKPVWTGGCLHPIIFPELTSHTFRPARGNALLVGEAAGLVMPLSGEGIGIGMKSGFLAADSIKKAIQFGKPADGIYLSEINSIISMFDKLYPFFGKIVVEARRGGHELPNILRNGYLGGLKKF